MEVDTNTDNSMAMYDDSSYADYDNYEEVTEHNYGGAISAAANTDQHAGKKLFYIMAGIWANIDIHI